MDILFLALITMFSFFISDIFYKYCSQYLDYYKTTALAVGFGILPMLLFLILGRFSFFNLILNYNLFLLIIISSIFLLIGYFLNFKTLKTEQVTHTFALSQIQPIMLILFGIFIMHESLELTRIVAIVFLITGSIFIISNEKFKISKQFIPAIFANILWGSYWFIVTIIININNVNSISMIFLARLISFIIALMFLITYIKNKKNILKQKTQKLKINKKIIAIIFLGALFDGIGNIIFVLIDKSNNLVFGSIFLAIIPALLGIFAYIVFKDKFTKLQLLGLFIIISTAILLSL